MNVLVISHMYPSPANEVYGVFVHEQVKALQALGCGVRVMAPIRRVPFPLGLMSRSLAAWGAVPPHRGLDGVQVAYPRYFLFPRAMFFHTSGPLMHRAVRGVAARIRREFPFDVIHAHVALPDGHAAVELGREWGVPAVVTVHGADVYQGFDRGPRCGRMIADVFARAARTIFVSGRLKRAAEKRIGRSLDAAVIGNGIPLDLVRPEHADRDAAPREGRTIFSASYLVPRKAIRDNILALAAVRDRHPDVRYVIAGDGPEAANLRRLAAESGVADRVEFVGMLSHAQTLERMAAADIFSLPSWNEAFGVVYIEAMAQGRPVIACRGEGIEDVVAHGETGWLVEPRNVDSLAAAFDELLSRPDAARAMGERARDLVLREHTWGRVAERIRDVYEDVVAAG